MNISTISTYEYAIINATWLTLIEEEFQCERIETLYKQRKDADTVIKYRRIERGCGVISDTPKVEIDGIAFHSCACHPNFKDESINDAMWLYDQYKKGHLAYTGGLLEQPSKYIELMRLLERLHNEHEIKLNEAKVSR